MPEYRITDDTANEVLGLLERDQEDLYAVLGYQLQGIDEPPNRLQIGERVEIPRINLIVSGKRFFEQILPKLKKVICDDWKFCERQNELLGDTEKLVKELIPAVAVGGITVFGALIPQAMLIVVVALAIKYGLKALCGC